MNNESRRIASGSELMAAWNLSKRPVDAAPVPRVSIEAEPPIPESTGECARTVVAGRLARLVHVGLLLPGDELPSERDLCEVYGVARQTVRAALGILEGRLMVAISHGRRSRVVGTGSLDEVDAAGALKKLHDRRSCEVFQALQLFEEQIASLAVQEIDAPALAQLDTLCSLLPRMARNALSYQILEYEIRMRVYGSCRNKLLADMAVDIYGHASALRRQWLARPSALERSVELQRQIVLALHQRDATMLKDAMREQAQALDGLTFQATAPRPAACEKKPLHPEGPFGLLAATRGALWPAV